MMDEFLLALQIFVQTNRLILDDGVGNFQAPLELLDNVALRAAKDHVYEKTLAMFRHAVGQPPRSAAECSSVATILLISSSGVAGRQMKIKSYKRSSILV